MTQKSDGSCNVTSDCQLLYKVFKKQPPLFCKHICKKHIASKECWFDCHDDNMCFLPNYRNHNILLGDIKDLLQTMDAFCFIYQQVDYLYTLIKNQFSGRIVVNSGQLFDNLQRAVHFSDQTRRVYIRPSIAKKRLLRKKYRKQMLSTLQKTKSTQNSRLVFAKKKRTS